MSLKEELLAAIKAAAAVVPKAVDLGPGFPTVYVRPRTVGEVDEQKAGDDAWIQSHALTASSAIVICDESGTLLFDPSVPEDLAAIKTFTALPWEITQKILKASRATQESEGGN
jgi:hypothetical protein